MQSLSVRFDLRFVVVLLLLIISVMLWLWQPWQSAIPKRTISVTGQGTVSAAPDEFVFTPSYQKSAATSKEAISNVSVVGNAAVAKLKELGLTGEDLKTNVYSSPEYDAPIYELDSTTTSPDSSRVKIKNYIATYSITAKAHDKTISQKILDYLTTTELTSAITPQTTFKETTTKRLEDEARVKGLADAKQKADQTTAGLGAKLGKVVSISEPASIGPFPYGRDGIMALPTKEATAPTLETGTNEVTYSITVVFEIK